MDPADAADGKRRTQAWMGPAIEPAPAPSRSLRWMPNPSPSSSPSPLPSYPEVPVQQSVSVQPMTSPRAPGVIVGGRYRLIRSLGQGSLTETWEASHVDLERGVAIKFLRESAVAIADRMVEEARAVARIRHPHVVELGDFGRTDNGEPFFVMELLAGQTVEQLLARRGVIPWARAVAIAQQVGEALGAAHQHGIVHRDLRPGNVFLVDTGQVGDFVKVVDFGLARGTTQGGTPSYMSPEQCRGEPLDPRSDVYAMGCLLFAMITGDPPFVGDPQRVIRQQLGEPAKALRERAPRQFIPDELEAIVTRCLAKHPSQRFADTRELAAGLASLAQFSAAASIVNSPIQDPSASGSRPMGYAGRPPPKSPRELTDSYKPVNQPIVDDAPDERPVPPKRPASTGMSTPAILGVSLAGLLAVAGVGVGMYWLVNRLIGESPGAEARQAPATAPAEATKKAAEPSPAAKSPVKPVAPAEAKPIEPAPAPAHEESAAAPAPVETTTKKSTSKRGAAVKDVPKDPPPPAPEPEPAPEPNNNKPSVDPDSKAKDELGHDELRDPWG